MRETVNTAESEEIELQRRIPHRPEYHIDRLLIIALFMLKVLTSLSLTSVNVSSAKFWRISYS